MPENKSNLKCKHSFENQEVGRHLETDSQITTRGTVSKAISIFCKLSHLGGNELCFMIFGEQESLSLSTMTMFCEREKAKGLNINQQNDKPTLK